MASTKTETAVNTALPAFVNAVLNPIQTALGNVRDFGSNGLMLADSVLYRPREAAIKDVQKLSRYAEITGLHQLQTHESVSDREMPQILNDIEVATLNNIVDTLRALYATMEEPAGSNDELATYNPNEIPDTVSPYAGEGLQTPQDEATENPLSVPPADNVSGPTKMEQLLHTLNLMNLSRRDRRGFEFTSSTLSMLAMARRVGIERGQLLLDYDANELLENILTQREILTNLLSAPSGEGNLTRLGQIREQYRKQAESNPEYDAMLKNAMIGAMHESRQDYRQGNRRKIEANKWAFGERGKESLGRGVGYGIYAYLLDGPTGIKDLLISVLQGNFDISVSIPTTVNDNPIYNAIKWVIYGTVGLQVATPFTEALTDRVTGGKQGKKNEYLDRFSENAVDAIRAGEMFNPPKRHFGLPHLRRQVAVV